MKTAIGISFGRDRVYAVQLSRVEEEIKLHAASSAAVPVTEGSSMMSRVADALQSIMREFPERSTAIGASIPPSWSEMHAFPSAKELSPSELQERSRWEITQHNPDVNLESAAATVFVLSRDPVMYLSVAYPKHLLDRLHMLFDALGQSLVATSVDPVQLSRAVRRNYRDSGDTPIAVVDMNGLAGLVTMLHGERMVLCAEEDVLNSSAAVIRAVEQAESRAGMHAQQIVIGGELLTAEILAEVKAGKQLRGVRRLNAFRSIVPHQLSPRSVAYCHRTAHLFSAAVGAALDALDREEHETKKVKS